ncbi:DUF262 domain-containing protein [Azotobacter chroococcum subsp. isscasi]|uniref:DUF262 domain-containing protein n=1 Tax=Azotobacter chroococcum TaxID=353 RepID=UPI00103EC530|nr:DUF262 domain-containing protein [Azotobacter chroococcum]TBW12821.1 DUF262 domain-containing protein [Azotobacter chroococcum subsp. isscasi]
MKFNPLHLKVAGLLEGRLFRIPEYQRAYSWTTRQRTDLFNDIEEAFRSGREHFMATLVALAKEKETRLIGVDEFKTVELIDGQQRVTTLIILIKAIEKALSEDDVAQAKVRREVGELLVKGDDHSLILLQTNHDTSQVFTNYIRKGLIDPEAVKTAADQKIVDAAHDCEQFVSRWVEHGNTIFELLVTIRNKLTIIYHEILDEATVYRVFEVLNSRGLDVKWIDKLKSQLMALIFEHIEGGTRDEAVSEMQSIWRSIYCSLGNSTRIGDEALRFAGAWAADTRPNRIPSEADSTALLTAKAGTQLKTIAEVGHELEGIVQANLKLFRDPRLRAVTRIVHARFVAAAILLRKFDKKTEHELLGKWERVTFRIYELASRDSRHKVGEYIRLGYDIYRGDLSKDLILQKLQKISDGYSIDDVLKNIDWSSSYEGWQSQLRYMLNRYDEHLARLSGQKINKSQWSKIWEQDPASSIEHIAPQSSGVPWVHHLGNLTMLPPGVNSSLKAQPPADKQEAYQSCGLIGTIQVGQQISLAHAWTEEMVLERAQKIEDFIRKEWAD